MKLVRIRPVNKKTGNTIHSYDYGGRLFKVGEGWYRVEDEVGKALEALTVDPYDESSAKVFDVMDAEEAAAKELQELKMRRKKAGLELPREHAGEPERVKDAPNVPAKPLTIKAEHVGSLSDLVAENQEETGVVTDDDDEDAGDGDETVADGSGAFDKLESDLEAGKVKKAETTLTTKDIKKRTARGGGKRGK